MFTGGVPVVLTKIGLSCPFISDGFFIAPVVASITQTFPGLSPTQSSVLLLAVNTPSGPEVSLSPVKPANPGLGNCVTPPPRFVRINHVDRFVVAICQEELLELWIEPADVKRKERGRARHLHDCRDFEHFVFLGRFPCSLSSVKAGPAIASMAMAPIPIPATSLFFGRNV